VITGGILGFGVNEVLDGIGSWVASGATWFLGHLGGALDASTRPDLGVGWFTGHFRDMAGLAALLVLPLLLLSVMQAVVRQDLSVLVRTILVHLPLAALLTGVAVELVQLSLAAVDAMSTQVAGGATRDVQHVVASVTSALTGASLAVGQPGAPAFVLFLSGLVVVFAAALLWLEMVVRTAAIYVAVLFLPLALATLVWPSISHWCRRLTETLVALVLSKLVVVAVLSLAASALAGSAHVQGVLTGIALLLLAAFAPFSLLRLVPAVEAGAVMHLEGMSRRVTSFAGSGSLPMPPPLATGEAGEGGDGAGLTVSVGDAPGEPGLGVFPSGAAAGGVAEGAGAGAAAGAPVAGGAVLVGRMARSRSAAGGMPVSDPDSGAPGQADGGGRPRPLPDDWSRFELGRGEAEEPRDER
jgi:hypothetical protein